MNQQPSANMGVTNTKALASLILSIGFVILGPFGSIPGIICGHLALREYKSAGIKDGQGMAMAGIIIGWIGLALFVIGLVVVLLVARHFGQTSDQIFDSFRSLPSR
jgi:Domain of unknown function (DUF4190)